MSIISWGRTKRDQARSSIVGLLLALLLIAAPLAAQVEVTADEVNRVAKQLYCPVCPNETLDICQTQACVQWRREIFNQLSAGDTPQQVIDSFARRYGERVLATPQDPALRALSLYTPFIVAAIALAFALVTFFRWTRKPHTAALRPTAPISTETTAGGQANADPYRSILERDLRE